ncbi:hypothetical protein V6R21_25210 [Limibacter armeniacum]|uniref:hypothetical protein n=1 Tax=Limibacter armeniacum TaxID=466084 RepID=UPI002FE6089C
MKKIIGFLFLLVLSASSYSYAQRAMEFTGLGGYQFGGKVEFVEGDLKIKDNANFAGIFSVELVPSYMLEIGYTRMDTRAEWRPLPFYQNPPFNYERQNIGASVEYFQIGGLREFRSNSALIPFAQFSAGAARLNDKDNSIDAWRLAITFGGGIKIPLADHFGLRFQGRLLMPFYFDGVGGYVGIGTGGPSTGLGVTSSVPVVQGDFSGGVYFRISQ